jgi:hypothetical protein
MEEEAPIVPFGKLNLKSKKNQDRVDKYCCYKVERDSKYKSCIRKAVPPFTRQYKKRIEFILPTPENSISTSTYFASDYFDAHLDRGVIEHCIGRVNFYEKEYVEVRKLQKILPPTTNYPITAYFYKPTIYLPYIPAPTSTVNVEEIAQFQRGSVRRSCEQRINGIVQYLRSTAPQNWDWTFVSCLGNMALTEEELFPDVYPIVDVPYGKRL